MSSQISIDPLAARHIPSFRECMDAVARERKYLAMLEAPTPEKVREFVTGNIQKGVPQFVAMDGDRIVGWCDIRSKEHEGFRHVGVMGMGVVAEYRGRGVGERLMKAAIERARALGLEIVELGVFASNTAAVALYRKIGFVEEGRRRHARKIDGAYDDVVMMALPLV